MSLAGICRNRLFRVSLAAMAVAAALTALWAWTPLGDDFTVASVAEWVESISSRWWTPWLLAVLFIPASLLMFPRQLITLAAVIVYGPWKGFLIAMAGVELATVLEYYVGRMVSRDRVERWAGQRLDGLTRVLRARGLAAVTAMRLLPLGPFAIVNAVAGALHVRVFDLVVGTFLGMLPGMIGTTLVGDQLAAGITAERTMNRWILGGALAGLVLVSVASWAWYKRLAREA